MFNNPLMQSATKQSSSPPAPESSQRTRNWLDQQLHRGGIASPPSSESSHDHDTPSSTGSFDNQKLSPPTDHNHDSSSQLQPFSKSFQFVAENDPDPRKTVRKHVMKEFQRERRFQRDVSGKPESARQRKRSNVQRPKALDLRGTQPASIADTRRKVSPSIPSSSFRSSLESSPALLDIKPQTSFHEVPLCSQSNPQTSTRHPLVPTPIVARSQSVAATSEINPSVLPYRAATSEPTGMPQLDLQTLLGEGRIDPFDSFPIKSDSSINALVDHYVCGLSYMMFRMVTRLDFNPIKETFKLAIQDAVSLNAILTYASSHVASLHGMQNTEQVVKHKGLTLALLTQKLNPATMDNSDGVIMAVQQLTSVEERWGSSDIAKTHWKGLKQLVDSRGGLEAIRKKTPRLEILIDFTDLVTNANQGPHLVPLSAPILCALPPPILNISSSYFYTTSNLFNVVDIPAYHNQLRQFLSNICALTAKCLSTPTHPIHVPRRHAMLYPGTTLHMLLCNALQTRGDVSVNPTPIYCQMACLLYLAATFYDYRDDGRMIDCFFMKLEANFKQWDLHALPSIETLLFVFEKGAPGTRLDCPERTWWVGRMMGLLKGVGAHEWEGIKDVLFRFVTVKYGGERASILGGQLPG